MPESRRGTWIHVIACLFLVLGLWVAVAFGHGFKVQGMACAAFFVACAGIAGLWALSAGATVPWKGGFVVGVVAVVYLASRAWMSPVWDFGRKDLILISCSWITMMVVAGCGRGRGGLFVVVAGIALSVVINFGYAIGQTYFDGDLRFLNEHGNTSTRAVGLFGHPNSLGGYLEVATLFLFGAGLTVRSWWGRSLLWAVALMGVGALVFSHSRGSMIGLAAGGLVLMGTFLQGEAHRWSSRKSILSWAALIVVALSSIPACLVAFSYVSSERGHGADAENVLSQNGRLEFMGLAAEQWLDSPVVGSGSRSYSYESVKRWDSKDIPSWVGYPQMAHCDYLQLLAEYGVVGLSVLLVFAAVALLRWPLHRLLEGGGMSSGLDYGAMGGITATMVHSAGDFTLHSLPIAMVTAVCFGVLLMRRGKNGSVPLRCGAVAMGFAVVLLLGWVCRLDWVTAPRYFAFERAVAREGGSEDALVASRELLERAPEFGLARFNGRLRLEQFEGSERQSQRLLEEALWGLELAVERHPYDAEALGNLALVLNSADQNDRAGEMYQRAIVASWRRERNFGVMGAYSDFLGKQGDVSWQRRDSSLALGYFQLSLSYLDASVSMHSRFSGKWQQGPRRRWLTERIEFLEGAGITPAKISGIPQPPNRKR